MNNKRKLTTLAKVLIAAVLVIAVVCVQFLLLPRLGFGTNKEMAFFSAERSVSYDFDSGAAFHSNDSRSYYFATRDSMRYMSSASDQPVWRYPFAFTNPWLAARGDYVAIGEESGGRVIYVFDQNGLLFQVSMEHTILSFWVNDTGFLSVVAEYEGGYGIYVFNQHRATQENPLFHWDFYHDLIAPTHVEVSRDGTYLAIARLDLSFTPKTSVQFRYMNQWDAWGTQGGLFATEDFPNQIVTALRFMNDNRLIVATTSNITCFQLGPGHTVSRRMWEIELENQKTNIEFYNGSHFAYAAGSRLPMVAGEGDPVGTVRIFGINGVQTGMFELGRRVTHLRMGHNHVIVGGERGFNAVTLRGAPIWEHTTLYDTRDVLFLDNINTILVAGSNQAEVFVRRRVREKAADNLGGVGTVDYVE
ncbi:MAG: DUF5711 family protein [Defluviitaleaceae bacterium]|nr:DUF5711 family protein [Defluviitaleaceae bacterium]